MPYDETRQTPYIEPDRKNSTKFNKEEAPPGWRLSGYETYEVYYDLLSKMNRGTHRRSETDHTKIWTYRKQLRRSDNLQLFDAISDTIDMIDRRRRLAKSLFKKFDYKKYSQPGDGGTTVALLAVCTCAYVCWKEDLQTHPNHTQKDERFQKILDELNVDNGEFEKWYGKMTHQLRKEGWGEGYLK